MWQSFTWIWHSCGGALCPGAHCGRSWKGTPQDCIDHVRGAHDVPWVVKSASIEQFVPPWTVRRQVWSDSLKASHSTDVLLFSDINLSLVHHSRIHKRGLPHIAFRKDYMSRLRTLLPSPVTQSKDSVLSPVSTGPVSLRQASSAELEVESPRRTIYAKWRIRPVRVMGGLVGDLPILTIQDPLDVQGARVYDCRPPLLPVLLQLSDIGPLPVRPTVVSASLAVPPWEDGLAISGVGPDVVAFPELGVALLVDSGTNLEDELPTPDGSPSTDAVKTGKVALPVVRPEPRGVIDLELEKVLLQGSILPMMMTPIVDPVVESSVTPALYPEPPLCWNMLTNRFLCWNLWTNRFLCWNRWTNRSLCWCLLPLGRWPEVQSWMPFHRTWRRLLAQCMNRSSHRSRRLCGQMIFPDRCPAWQRWTSTCRVRKLNCCWGVNGLAPSADAFDSSSDGRGDGSGIG